MCAKKHKSHTRKHRLRRSRGSKSASSLSLPIFFFICSLGICVYQTLYNPSRLLSRLTSPLANVLQAQSPSAGSDSSSRSAQLPPIRRDLPNSTLGTRSKLENSFPANSTKATEQFSPLAAVESPTPSPLPSFPTGPVPLPHLGGSKHAAELTGASWSASVAKGLLSHLPAFLKARALSPSGHERAPGEDSIFTARRKGRWMGCSREWHLVCKGVYKAIKATGAIRVLDVSCARNAAWLPLVITKLREEYRLVNLWCGDRNASAVAEARAAYRGLDHVTWKPFDPFGDPYTRDLDLLLAYDLLRHQTLIRAMHFFRRAKHSGRVRYLTFDNHPSATNSPSALPPHPVNVLQQPFMFPTAFSLHASPDDQPAASPPTQIMTMRASDLFAHSFTPRLADLMDPRRRRRLVRRASPGQQQQQQQQPR